MKLYLLAALGAALGVVGDVLGTAAARGYRPALSLTLSALCWAGCAPIWFLLSKHTGGGFNRPGALWGMVGAVMWAAVSLSPWAEPEPAYKRVLVLTIMTIVIAREVG